MNNRNGMGGGAGNTGSSVDQRIGSIKESVRGMVDHGQERMHQLKDKVSDVKQQAMSRSSEYLERVAELIRANPLKSIAIAFGVGYLGMRLFRR